MKTTILILSLIFSYQTWAINTVETLDIDQYMGKWNQIGAIPQRFARNCVRNTTAEYTKLDNGLIEVKNSCVNKDDETTVAMGRARINEEFNETSKLEVTFVKIFGNWVFSFGGDYWVTALEKDYKWALVGHPELSGLYILARGTTLSKQILKNMRELIESQGYDSCEIIMSPTPDGDFKGDERFCDLKL